MKQTTLIPKWLRFHAEKGGWILAATYIIQASNESSTPLYSTIYSILGRLDMKTRQGLNPIRLARFHVIASLSRILPMWHKVVNHPTSI